MKAVYAFVFLGLLVASPGQAEEKNFRLRSDCRIDKIKVMAGPGVASVKQTHRCGNMKTIVFDPTKTSQAVITKKLVDGRCTSPVSQAKPAKKRC